MLATSFVEAVRRKYPTSEIHFLLRKGNETLLEKDPRIARVWIWDKKKHKLQNLWKLARQIRAYKFDTVFNLQRFASSGFISAFSGAAVKSGFDKNPFSFSFSKRVAHKIPYEHKQGFPYKGKNYLHEVQRNLLLLIKEEELQNCGEFLRPNLYLPESATDKSAQLIKGKFVVIAPASVWFTKQWPAEKWIELIGLFPPDLAVAIVGAPMDSSLAERLIKESGRGINLCGKLKLLETAALMKQAQHVFTNDSAPMHLASAVNAPTTGIFCATRPSFGFGPLADKSRIIESDSTCCSRGIHGESACREGHFRCAMDISAQSVYATFTADFENPKDQLSGQDNYQQKLHEAVKILQRGAVLLHETDTVAGLACDVASPTAREKIFEIKQREKSKSVLLLLSGREMLKNFSTGKGNEQDAVMLEKILDLIEESNDPVTVVVRPDPVLPAYLYAQDGTVAVRIPTAKSLRELIALLGRPLLSTSANKSGRPTPVKLAAVDKEIRSQVDFELPLPAAEDSTGIPSALIKLEGGRLQLLRDGKLPEALREMLPGF